MPHVPGSCDRRLAGHPVECLNSQNGPRIKPLYSQRESSRKSPDRERGLRRVRSPRSGASSELQALVECRVAAHWSGHQEAIALAEDALDIVGIDVGMADDDVVLLAGIDHPLHPFEHLGMLVLARQAELLGEVAFADQDGADARDLLEDLGQVLDADGVLHHQDDEDLALGIERPHIGAVVVFLLGEAPIAHGLGGAVAADAGRMIERRLLQAGIAAGRDRVLGFLDG